MDYMLKLENLAMNWGPVCFFHLVVFLSLDIYHYTRAWFTIWKQSKPRSLCWFPTLIVFYDTIKILSSCVIRLQPPTNVRLTNNWTHKLTLAETLLIGTWIWCPNHTTISRSIFYSNKHCVREQPLWSVVNACEIFSLYERLLCLFFSLKVFNCIYIDMDKLCSCLYKYLDGCLVDKWLNSSLVKKDPTKLWIKKYCLCVWLSPFWTISLNFSESICIFVFK